MRDSNEFKALVEQKMKQQRHAARIRRQRMVALCASLCVLVLVVSVSFYFLKNPIELPLLPEDSIPETESQIINQDSSSAAGHTNDIANNSTTENAGGNAGNSGGNNSTSPADSQAGSASTGSSANSGTGGSATTGSIGHTMGTDRTINAADVTAVEYRIGKQTSARSTDKRSIEGFLKAMLECKQKSVQCTPPDSYQSTLQLIFYNGKEELLTLILTEDRQMICNFPGYMVEVVELSQKNYEDLYDLAPTPFSTPVKGEGFPVAGTVFDGAALTVGSASASIDGAEMYALYDMVDEYFTESRQRKVTFRKATHLLQYTDSKNPENTMTISLDSSTGALRWQYAQQEMQVALNADQRKQLTNTLGSYIK